LLPGAAADIYVHAQHMCMERVMAAATERVVILMTKPEKRSLESKARRIGTSAAELVRRSVSAYDPYEQDESTVTLIESLLEQLGKAHKATLSALERAERELAKTRAYFDRKRVRQP
jgi:phosphate uptake regulator